MLQTVVSETVHIFASVYIPIPKEETYPLNPQNLEHYCDSEDPNEVVSVAANSNIQSQILYYNLFLIIL